MNLNLKILQNIMILVFGISSLMHASSSSSSSIAQRLVQAAAGQAASTGQQRVAAPSADNKAQQEDAHNPASAQSSSAGAIAEVPILAMWTSSLAPSSSSSANGFTFSAQAGVPAIKVKAKVYRLLPDEERFSNYSEENAEKEYKKDRDEAEKYCKEHNAGLFECITCGETRSDKSVLLNHVLDKHLEKKSHFACQCARFYSSKTNRNIHRKKCPDASPEPMPSFPAQVSVSALNTTLNNYSEAEAKKQYGRYKIEAQKYCVCLSATLYKCEECQETGTTRYQVVRHIISAHLLDGKLLFKCEKCNRFFRDTRARKGHDNTCKAKPQSSMKSSSLNSSSTSSNNSSSGESMQPAGANAIAPTALFASADNKAQQENEHNPASAQSSSARAIAEAHALAMRASSLSSSSNSSSSGSTHPAQVGVPALTAAAENDSVRKQNAVRRNAKQVKQEKTPKPDEASLASYSEAAAEKKYKECKKQAAKFYVIRQGIDNEQGSKKANDCLCTICNHTGSLISTMVEHIAHAHLLEPLFACLKCGALSISKTIRNSHAMRCKGLQSSKKSTSVNSSSTSSNNSSSGESMQPAGANAIAPTALFTSADNKAQQENEHNPASAQSSSARAIAEVHALTMRASSLSSSNNSSSGGFMQPAGAFAPAVGANNGATASLLPAEPVEMQTARQAQSNGKRKDSSPHKQPSSKKQKIDQQEIEKPAQNFPSSSSSASAAVAATLLASSASSSSSSFHDMHGALAAINPIANPSALLDSLSASTAAQAALHAGDASLLPRDFVPLGHAVQQAAPSEVLLAQQNLDASLPDLALLLEAGLSDSHGSTSAQANAIAQSALPISADDETFGTLAPLPPSSIEHYIDEVDAEKFFGNLG